MQPYTYSESPLTPYAERDAEFAGGAPCGSVAPNARLNDGSYLLDRAGNGMTAILFCEGQPSREHAALLAQLGRIDKRFVPVLVTSSSAASEAKAIVDGDGEIARLFAAASGTFYLLRPDLHIAGRWKAIVAAEILKTAGLCLGSEMP
jgi:3-(3-hydroxy-phenyl)propionate hydroxylase